MDDEDDLQSERSSDENNRLPAMTSFLHTIPENAAGSEPTSVFNPALVEESLAAAEAAAAGTSPTAASLGLEDGDGDGQQQQSWSAMMRPFQRASQNRVPPAPGSVASSTRAVEAGNAGTRSNLGTSSSGVMDGSTTAEAGGRSDLEAGGGGIGAGGDLDSTLAEQAGRAAHHLASTTATTTPALAGAAGGKVRPGAGATRKKPTRRPSALARADKRKVGLVCIAALLVVIVVVISLIVIVAKLDKDDSDDPVGTADGAELLGDGTNTTDNSTTTGGNDEELPTLAPTVAESSYNFAASQGVASSMSSFANSNQDQQDDDDDDNIGDGTGGNSILESLDEAILRLYQGYDQQGESTKFNMLPHVSSEVFSHGLSPRYKAREWLLNNDTLLQTSLMENTNVDLDSEGTSEETLDRIAQRYIMLVFYFSTDGTQQQQQHEVNQNIEEEGTDTEINNPGGGQNRQMRRQLQQQEQSTTTTSTATTSSFQIYPDVHECFWVPNGCGQDQDGGSDAAGQEQSTTAELSTEYIKYINLPNANLMGTLPFELGYLSGLQELVLPSNKITGQIPELLVTQPQYLYVLDLSQNSFQGSIPPSLWSSLPALRFAYLHGNQLTGTIPAQRLSSSLAPPDDASTTTATTTVTGATTTGGGAPTPPATESNLEEIWLRDNQLEGNIPQWWATDLPALDVLSVRNNSWTGSLPLDWTAAKKLKYMDVSHNELSGNIPATLLYGIPALEYLYLDYNKLVGTLPTTETMMSTTMVSVNRETDVVNNSENNDDSLKMQALWLQYNQLTGTIPKGFGWEWQQLKTLELHGNQLTGQWECMESEEDDNADVWPQLEELAVDCISANNNPQNMVEGGGGGVDISMCKACCIKCY